MEFAAFLRNRMVEVYGTSSPSQLRAHLSRYGIEVTRTACEHWLAGARRPSGAHLHALLDALCLAGPDRGRAMELWLAAHAQQAANAPGAV